MWHPSGESTDVITLSDNHILKWEMEASGTNGRVRKLRLSDELIKLLENGGRGGERASGGGGAGGGGRWMQLHEITVDNYYEMNFT